jgi:hypothetical protein
MAMTDPRSPSEPDEPPLSMGEAIDAGIRRTTTAVIIAAGIVGLAIYARPGPPRFEAVVDGDRIVRIDTRKGTIISCQGQQTCQLILKSGQRLTRVKRSDAPAQPQALPKPAPPIPAAAAPAAEK